MKRYEPKFFIIPTLIAVIIATVISYFINIPFWGTFLIALGAIYINGLIAEKEDNMPGGFLNPHGDNPKWPLIVTFEDGTREQYEDEEDIECNLEFFNSDQDTECKVTDADGKEVFLVLQNLKIEELKLKNK